MPMREWSMRAPSVVVAYLRQRARLQLLAPLSALLALAGASFVAPWTASLREIGIATGQAFALVLGFRIWDDFEDREFDRVQHPDRVLASASRTTPLQLLAFALGLASVLSLTTSVFALRRLAAIAFATAVLSVWYGARSTAQRSHAVGEHILAIKYPLIAYAVTPAFPVDVVTPRIVAILFVVYTLVCAYAYADDVELRHIFTSRRSTT